MSQSTSSVRFRAFALRHRSRLGAVALGILLALASGYVGAELRSRRPEVVFVRTAEVMTRYKGAIQGREKFQAETSAWNEECRQLEVKMQGIMKASKPSDPKAAEEVRQISSRIRSLKEKGAALDQELMAPMLAEVNAGIKKFAHKHGYKLVLGTLQGGVVLHGDETVDVTDALIAELNR